jgi:hypothetical protein
MKILFQKQFFILKHHFLWMREQHYIEIRNGVWWILQCALPDRWIGALRSKLLHRQYNMLIAFIL